MCDHEQEIAELRAALLQAREDAQRWQMALKKAMYHSIDREYLICPRIPGFLSNCAAEMTAEIDAAIDAARQAQEGEKG